MATLVIAACGCREELGPIHFDTTNVSGEVREAGRAVAGGFIEFAPVEGTVGNLRSAPIARDGRFVVTGVAVGRCAISLVDAPIRLRDGDRLFRLPESPIRRQIPPGRSCTVAIDLLTEALIHEKEKARTTAPPPPKPRPETPR